MNESETTDDFQRELEQVENEFGPIDYDGIIIRRGDKTIVYALGMDTDKIYSKGEVCLNPNEPDPSKRIWKREFTKRRIYLPDEEEQAKQEVLQNPQLVLGMTGHTDITLERLGISNDNYEDLSSKALTVGLDTIHDSYNNADGSDVRIGLVYGGVKQGIDGAVFKVARQYHIPALVYNCPRYMFSMTDEADDDPIYVANNKAEYSKKFVESLDLLFSVGGKEMSLRHDLDAAIHLLRKIILVDIIGLFTQNDLIRDSDGNIINATLILLRNTGLQLPYKTWRGCLKYIRKRVNESVGRYQMKILHMLHLFQEEEIGINVQNLKIL